MKKTLAMMALAAVGMLLAGVAHADNIDLTGGAHTENFDTFLNTGGTGGGSIPIDSEIGSVFFSGTVKEGWWNGSGTSFGTSTSGAQGNSSRLLSFGVDTVAERALGLGWRDGGLAIGAEFENATGAAITQLDIRYDGELWYTGPASTIGQADTLTFEYSTNATSVLDGGATWNAVTALNFTAPTDIATGASGTKTQFTVWDGNDANNRVAGITSSITGLSIANGSTFFVRWSNSASHAAGIDNFSITPTAVPEPTSLGMLGVACLGLIARRRRSN